MQDKQKVSHVEELFSESSGMATYRYRSVQVDTADLAGLHLRLSRAQRGTVEQPSGRFAVFG